MLRRLEIENFGLISHASIEFSTGATIFTGETGSGKTMLVGALEFVLGARAAADLVARGSRKTIVSLTFEPDDVLRSRLNADGFEIDPGEAASVVREQSEGGRTAVRVNGKPSTAAYVRALSETIAEIVGQHEAQRLLAPAYHLEQLDRFAGSEALQARTAVAAAYARAVELEETLTQLQRDDEGARRRHEDNLFAAGEIEAARLEPGEDDKLEARRRYLDNAERIGLALRAAHEALAGDDAGAIAELGNASVALGTVSEISVALRAMAEKVGAMQSEATDVASELSKELDETALDSGELETLNARLDAIGRLKHKYGGTIDAVLACASDARASAAEYEGRDRRIAALAAEVANVRAGLGAAAQRLSALRQKAGAQLAKRVVDEFAEIALASGRFEVAFDPLGSIGPNGAERVEFLFAANAGEPARPLSRVASGGELSRVLLALVVVLAGLRGDDSALVFDEIDAGIGGATAAAVGARIGKLAHRGQVVCVTHLAQLATWADRHYVLDKTERKRTTTISVRSISAPAQREEELARMLSGETHEVAVKHARALLQARSR
ncbi:MAG: DNA repair protein RecN [Candidatus Eremiobacteraeota bacterium]|nr:DNA repair protein RecN [Candidatus Eremiobacteraeota bacterium]